MPDTEAKEWFVVITRPRWEKKVAGMMEESGIENYCPLNRVVRQWSDRRKVVLEPLFKGYVFVKLPVAAKWDVKNIPGVLNFVYWLGEPAIVREEEIVTIRKFLREFEDVTVSERLQVNDKVVVKQGVMMDYQGVIVEVQGNRARVAINSMGVELSAVFDQANLLKARAI